MQTEWSLENIYPSLDSAEFKEDARAFGADTEKLNTWAKTAFLSYDDAEKTLCEYIVMKNRLMYYEKLEIYVNLALSTDTSDEALASAADMLSKISAESAEHEALFARWLKGMDREILEAALQNNAVLGEHSYYIKEALNSAEHMLSEGEELIISRLKNTGSSLWKKQWEQLTSGTEIRFEYGGREYKGNLSDVRNMAYSDNAGLRKAAYEAELASYSRICEAGAFCMNGIKGEVITVCNLRGYSSPLDEALEKSRIDRDILNALLTAVKGALPSLTRCLEAKARLLGCEGSKLPFYELFAPVSEDRSYTPEQARDTVINSFYTFSEELGDFARSAFEKRWIDLMPRRGKVGGAFCEAVHSIKESRILANFGGTFNDAVTIAHELGHAYHDSGLYNASPLNSFYPMPVAETASTFCERIVINEALKAADDKSRLVILENDLSGIIQTVADIYSRFVFEDRVFDKRRSGILSASELCSLMLSAQEEAYCGTLSPESMHGYMWLCKPHYYDAEFNYYNFPYAFGMLLARALYNMYKAKGSDFIPLYDSFLSMSAVSSPLDAAASVGFDLRDTAFWQSSLADVQREADEFIAAADGIVKR